jgi:hypothetical protein
VSTASCECIGFGKQLFLDTTAGRTCARTGAPDGVLRLRARRGHYAIKKRLITARNHAVFSATWILILRFVHRGSAKPVWNSGRTDKSQARCWSTATVPTTDVPTAPCSQHAMHPVASFDFVLEVGTALRVCSREAMDLAEARSAHARRHDWIQTIRRAHPSQRSFRWEERKSASAETLAPVPAAMEQLQRSTIPVPWKSRCLLLQCALPSEKPRRSARFHHDALRTQTIAWQY